VSRGVLQRLSLFGGVTAAAAVLLFPSLLSADTGGRAEFSRMLAQGYAEVAKFADIRLHDQSGQSYFANKSDRARALYDVAPEWPTNWSLAPSVQQAMMSDRRLLISALSRLDAGADPKTEAIAQVNFDCWVALSSVSSLGAESERCRHAFKAALQQLGSSQ